MRARANASTCCGERSSAAGKRARRRALGVHGMLLASAYAMAMAGGAFIGFSACGGVAWHAQSKWWTLAAIAAFLVVALRSPGRPLPVRLVHAAMLFVASGLSQALAWPFYPGFDSGSAYIVQVWSFFVVGPC
jgi:hypothetical protein